MEPIKSDLLALSDKFFDRFTARLDGLTDEEYLWEPAPDCWSIEPDADGKLRMTWGLIFDEPAPTTTIAWRYTHISDLLQEERCATWIGVSPEPDDLLADGAPPDAAGARGLLDASFARWKRYLSATPEAGLFEPLGKIAGEWAGNTRMFFILHILDEVIHHGAEVGVLRDIYRSQQSYDPVVSALLRGQRPDQAAIEGVRAAHPDLTLLAAATARWDAIPLLLDLGFGIEGRNGRTPLHHAAADGRLDLMQRLIDAGADLQAKDPVYDATPLEWAAFFGRDEAAALLKAAYRLRSLNA
jgi:hypothetical protein